ncbi:chlorophyllase 1 [Euphorbia peplus]|nr:chlorophyllase 1 [Euphorbia peplus]
MSLWLFLIVLSSSPFLQNSEAGSVFNKGPAKPTYCQVDGSKAVNGLEKRIEKCRLHQVDFDEYISPIKPLLIVTPTVEGTYPVVLFLHGTCLLNSYYTDLLLHISSHGYIIVAPQLYTCPLGFFPILPEGKAELDDAAKVTNWLLSGLQAVLPENVVGDLEKLSVGGHSRGGKIAFALALGYAETPLQVKISALVGLAPVEGKSENEPIPPYVLTYEPDSLNLRIPVVVLGTGLGNQPAFPFAPVCSPNGVNHDEYFNECKAPAAHFVVSDYGHMDMLNDMFGKVIVLTCKGSWYPKDPMRRSIGGIIVAFLDAYLEGKIDEYMSIVEQPSLAPAKLMPVQFKSSYANVAQL